MLPAPLAGKPGRRLSTKRGQIGKMRPSPCAVAGRMPSSLRMIKFAETLSRREVVGGGVAAGLLGSAAAVAQLPPAAQNSAPKPKVTVVLNGMTYIYPNGPTIPSYYVSFRGDGRIVFHLGALGDLSGASSTAKPHHLPAHRVQIESDGKLLLDANIPAHWWNAEWTYRPGPIKIVRSPDQIVAAHRLFPFGDTGCRVNPVENYKFAGPMDNAGITIYMPTTGERPDIGWVTDPSGHFMLTKNPGPMLAWAQAAGSCPMHFRDEATGKPIDLIKYPQANAYDLPRLQGAPWLPKGEPDARAPIYTNYGGGWMPQQAHFCEMSYVAYLASGDFGFLEDLQYSANFCVLADASHSSPNGAVVSGETRGAAWAWRELFMAHAATQDAEAAGALPASCHPSSYFKKLLDHSLAAQSRDLTDPNLAPFHLVCAGGIFGPWQIDYALTSLAFGILTGHSDWTRLYLWELANVIARTNGTSGFPPGYGTPYYMGIFPDGDSAFPRFQTWGQAFDELRTSKNPDIRDARLTEAIYNNLKADPLNGGRAFTGGEYMMTTRAALVMADYLDKKGLAEVRKTYPDFDASLKNANRMFLANGAVNARVSVVSTV